jgi:hypothetical protein
MKVEGTLLLRHRLFFSSKVKIKQRLCMQHATHYAIPIFGNRTQTYITAP